MDEDDSELTDEPANPHHPRQNAGPKQNASQPPTPAKDNSTQPSKRVHAAMSPQTAYIMTSLLQGGVRQGTGARMVQYVKRRDLAGKTGTTNNAEDTWFIGFSPEFTAGVWVGFDEKRPLGSREEGAQAALPVWGYFMRDVLGNRPEKEFPVPPDITFKEVPTFAGSPTEGFSPRIVREPVYTPFAGKTLVLCPIDTPETLAAYRVPLPGLPVDQSPYGYQQTGQPQPPPYPVHPMDGGNLFPEQPPPVQGVAPGQPEGPRGASGDLNVGPPAQTGYLSDSEAPVRPSMGNPQPPRRGLDQPRQHNLNPREGPSVFSAAQSESIFLSSPRDPRSSMTRSESVGGNVERFRRVGGTRHSVISRATTVIRHPGLRCVGRTFQSADGRLEFPLHAGTAPQLDSYRREGRQASCPSTAEGIASAVHARYDIFGDNPNSPC